MPREHIAITVSGTRYPLVIDPQTYSEVDIVDFAPRAVSGTQAFSELGLYLDVAQDRWSHGFGKHVFSDPASYAYSGHLVDTRHGFASLFTDPVTVGSAASSTFTITKMAHHRSTMLIGRANGLSIIKSDGAYQDVHSSWGVNDLISVGRYALAARANGRLQLIDVGNVGSATSTTLTADIDHSWTTDIFTKNGNVYIYEGTGAGQLRTVTANGTDGLTVSVAWTTTPDATSKFVVWGDAGVDGNPPNNFYRLALHGGYVWGAETNLPWLHYWSEVDASDAEGGQSTDTAAIQVGPGTILINNLFSFENQLYVCREDGVWTIGDDRLAYHALDFSDQSYTDNFKTATVWNGFAFFPVRNTLYKFRSGLQDLTPPRWNDEVPYKMFGDFSALLTRGKYLYTIARSNAANAGETYETTSGFASLLATDGVGWHKLLDLPVAGSWSNLGMWFDPTNDYLYIFGVTASTGKLFRVQLQALSDLPYASFPTTGNHYLYSSYYDLGMQRIPKSFASLTVDGDFPTNTSIVVSYRIDNATAWTSLGTWTTNQQALTFPSGAQGKRIQFRFDLQTTSAGSSPYLKAIIIKLMMRPSVLYGVTCDVFVDDNLRNPDRSKTGLTATEIRSALKAARNSVPPITLEDIYGVSSSVYLSSVRFLTVEFAEDDIRTIARCTFVNV